MENGTGGVPVIPTDQPNQTIPEGNIPEVKTIETDTGQFQEEQTPFYKEFSFWILILLVFFFVGIILFWALPLFKPPFKASVVMEGGQVRLKVENLSVTKIGYIVVRRVVNGLPDALVEVSTQILPDDYELFFVPLSFGPDTTPEKYYQDLVGSELRIDYFTDLNSDNMYTKEIDTEILKDAGGGKRSVNLINGTSEQK